MPSPPFSADLLAVTIPAITGIAPLGPIVGIPGVLVPSPTAKEFRLDALPPTVKQSFAKGSKHWPETIKEAIRLGIKDSKLLADVIFFMQHPERMTGTIGKLIQPVSQNEEDFYKLRAEWNLCRTIVERILSPGYTPPQFLEERRSSKYDDYVNEPTTGLMTLMLNGRNWDGSGNVSSGFSDERKAWESMEQLVQSLAAKDWVYIANWQFAPDEAPLMAPIAGASNWAELLVKKAIEGVKIRVLVSDLPRLAASFDSDFAKLKTIVESIQPKALRENLKFVASKHPARLLIEDVGSHHQKFMVVRKGDTTIAYCGGLDISRNRSPAAWSPTFVWHDIHVKLEGLIVSELEREFVLRWNREKDGATNPALPEWKGFEELKPSSVPSADRARAKNGHKLQLQRTVSVGITARELKRDDIWQGYFQLIGRATRFIYLENQYFQELKLADALVLQAQARPELVTMVVLASGSDDPKNNAYVQHCLAVRHDFFARLIQGIPANRLRVYTIPYAGGLLHSKLALVDDEALSIGSSNANAKGFFIDSELNLLLEDARAVTSFRHQLWAHNLRADPAKVAAWKVSEFFAQWDAVAQRNDKVKDKPGKIIGEGIIPYDPRTSTGRRIPLVPDIVC